jgi:uncharacterized membrane-anchored protein YhcB (DUF1043 family)
MDVIIALGLILAATVAVGYVIRRYERQHRSGLTQEQLEVLQDVVDRMRKQREDNIRKD